MSHIKMEYVCGDVIEVEKYHTARYGSPGKSRQKKEKATPLEIEKRNEWNALKKLRRLINCNFGPDDYHLILTYRKEERPTPEEARNIINRFFRKLRTEFKKNGEQFKWILTTEYKSKAIHHHIIVNGSDNFNVVKAIRRYWTYGRPKLVPLDDSREYSKLAEYFVKETANSFREKDNPNKSRYQCSRNLKKPEVHKKIMKRSEWAAEPKPKKGYYILKDTIIEGVNPVTGYRYQSYSMKKLRKERAG